MSRQTEITNYWNTAALHKNVDDLYISDISTELCKKDLGKLSGKVLEIGCGVGRLMEDGYYGIDISKNMLDIAKKRKPQCHFKLCTDTIPYKDSLFDTVYCYLVIQHLKPDEVQKYFNEVYRVLKLGGWFKFQFIEGTEREPLSNHYTFEDITKFAEEAGFQYGGIVHESFAHDLWTIVSIQK